jgi:hypothetical protein
MNPGTIPEYSKRFKIAIVDTIREYSSPWPSRRPDDPMITHLSSDQYSIHTQRQLYKWVLAAIELSATYASHRYPSPESLVMALWRTLIGELRAWQDEPVGEEHWQYFKDWMAVQDIFDEFEEEIQSLSTGQRGSDRLEAAVEARFGAKPPGSSTLGWVTKPMKWITKASMICAWRRFCITESGYIGLVPLLCLPGDCVVIISGVKTPFVFRRLETVRLEVYEIVGECYVHGIMDGEAASPNHMRDVMVM